MLPVITEIEIHDFEIRNLTQAFKKNEVGNRPCFLELNLKQRKHIEPALDNIMAALEIIGVDPRFPYPLYIITPVVRKFLDLPLLSDRSKLPKHFFCKTQKLNSKEQSLLKKTKVVSQKIGNNEISNITIHIQSKSNTRRLLSEVCQENEFLESIVSGLQSPGVDREV